MLTDLLPPRAACMQAFLEGDVVGALCCMRPVLQWGRLACIKGDRDETGKWALRGITDLNPHFLCVGLFSGTRACLLYAHVRYQIPVLQNEMHH